MIYHHTTQIPNHILDKYLPSLSFSEMKILLVITRQTYGWMQKKTNTRKSRDRISNNQFRQKTGLSLRVITSAIKSLVTKGLISVTDYKGTVLFLAEDRKGKPALYYSITQPQQTTTPPTAPSEPEALQKGADNKNNTQKTTVSKLKHGFSHIGETINSKLIALGIKRL